MKRSGRSVPLAACLLASLVAHASLMDYLGAGPRHAGWASSSHGQPVRIQARLLEASPAVYPLPSAAGPSVDLFDPTSLQKVTLSTASDLVGPVPAVASPPERERIASTEQPTVSPPSSASMVDPLEDYVPRPLLSVAPVLQSTVMLTWPDQPGLLDGRYSGVLTLYIDEFGAVRRAESEIGGLPAPLAEVAKAAFMGGHFEPGQVDGQIVKSRIRVAVEFESRATAAAKRP